MKNIEEIKKEIKVLLSTGDVKAAFDLIEQAEVDYKKEVEKAQNGKSMLFTYPIAKLQYNRVLGQKEMLTLFHETYNIVIHDGWKNGNIYIK
jgi:hypothetical protein